jgi:hypothetical protein
VVFLPAWLLAWPCAFVDDLSLDDDACGLSQARNLKKLVGYYCNRMCCEIWRAMRLHTVMYYRDHTHSMCRCTTTKAAVRLQGMP